MNQSPHSKPFGWKRLPGMCCVAFVTVALLATGCASEQRKMAPAAWYNVRPGMQREQVHALLGMPTQENLGGAEEIYINAVNNAHSELHIQYDVGGTVAAKRYHYVK
jgi:hypothetical protein